MGAQHCTIFCILLHAYAITMDNLRLLSSGIRLQRDSATPLDNCEVEILQQMLKFKTSCAVLAYLSSNLLNEVGLSLFRYLEVGLLVCDIVVKKFTSAISHLLMSSCLFLPTFVGKNTLGRTYIIYKAATRGIYSLKQLKSAGLSQSHILHFQRT